VETSKWLDTLKSVLNIYGKEPIDWEIYRGDHFQCRVSAVSAMKAAIHIKARMKQLQRIDTRISIGIGSEDYYAGRISESNGSAYVLSGESFDKMNNLSLIFASENDELNKTMNTMIPLALLTADYWTPAVSETISMVLENPGVNQS
jgi:hypothetical protein